MNQVTSAGPLGARLGFVSLDEEVRVEASA
jgi:hypothetical protein